MINLLDRAHERLHTMIPFSTDRRYFGLSRPEKGRIEYKAAAEPLNDGELEGLGLIQINVKKGDYASNYGPKLHGRYVQYTKCISDIAVISRT